MCPTNAARHHRETLVLVNAVDLAAISWQVDREQAAARLRDIARVTGAHLDDVAALDVASDTVPAEQVLP